MNYTYKNIKENLSNNINCEWSIIKKSKLKKKYNIISVSFFLIKNKVNNNKYINGIKHIIENFYLYKTYILRIYFDISVRKILEDLLDTIYIKNKSLKILKNIELFEYNIPLLKDGPNNHIGYIGTIIRFLPLFDNSIHKSDKCVILDIDNIIKMKDINVIDFCEKNNVNVCYRTRFGYSLDKRIYCLSDKIILDYPIIASFIHKSNIDIPYNILSDFLENTFLNNHNKILDKCNLKSNDYGIDEIFINKYFLNYIYKNNIVFAPIIFNYYNIYSTLTNYIQLINNIEEIDEYIIFINMFFKILHINLKIKYNKYLKIKKIKMYVFYNIKNNYKEINNKLNMLFDNEKDLNFIKNILLNKIKIFNNKTKFYLLLKNIYQNLNIVKKDKILIHPIQKNYNKILFYDCNIKNLNKYYINS
jgi:hypothetical protein